MDWVKLFGCLSLIFIAVSILIYGFSSYHYDKLIFENQSRLDNLTGKMSIFEDNFMSFNVQSSKIVSTSGIHSVSKDLKLPCNKSLENHLKAQIIDSMYIDSDFNKSQACYEELMNLSIGTLEDKASLVLDKVEGEWALLVTEKNEVIKNIGNMIRKKSHWNLAALIIEMIGLFFGIIAFLFKEEKITINPHQSQPPPPQ